MGYWGMGGDRFASHLRRRFVIAVVVVVGLVVGVLPVGRVGPAVAADPVAADVVVLVNSDSAGYGGFTGYVRPYLDHFGFPYSVVDVALSPVGAGIGDHAVIVVGHRSVDPDGTFLDGAENAALVAAVDGGAGLVSFDNDLSPDGSSARYAFVDTIFGFTYSGAVAGSDVAFAGSGHYITERHDPSDVVATGPMTLSGIGSVPGGVSAVAVSAGQPFVTVTDYGAGRAVQWGSYDWMSHDVLGPVFGLDELVWRSIVWAARKPFVMQGMPPFVTMRMDDTDGSHGLGWVDTANDYGFKPWLGVFFEEVPDAVADELAGVVADGDATVSIHSDVSATSGDFFYFDHSGGVNLPDATVTANFAAGTQWHVDHEIPVSSHVVAHYYEVGSNAFAGLADWGVEFVGIPMEPGQPYEESTPWLNLGPYRLVDDGPSRDQGGDARPVFYADWLTVPGHPEFDGQFFDCFSEIRDVTGYEWYPGSTSTANAIDRGVEWLTRGLDSMILASLFSHEYEVDLLSAADWQTILAGVSAGIADYDPIPITIDDACRYVRATTTADIGSASFDPDTGVVTATFAGAADVDTMFYVFVDTASGIRHELVDVPSFAGSTVVTVTPSSAFEVVGTVPVDGASGVSRDAGVTATFSDGVDPLTLSTDTFVLRDDVGAVVSATVSYDAATRTALLDPVDPLVYSSDYEATVSSGVTDVAGRTLAGDVVWAFTTAAAPSPLPDDGPGGPVLVIADAGGVNPFGRYLGDVLLAEGLNEYSITDISAVDVSTLAGYDVAVLGEMSLSAAQAAMFADWVTAGGNLVAMRPDADLAPLLGLTPAPGSLAEGYLLVDTTTSPGAGIVDETIQYHGTADYYSLDGAAEVATLYSTASAATVYPAVTINDVGSAGGQAAAFMYDLARSVVHTRQGNPAWEGINGDGNAGPVRADDMFHNATDTDWVDLDKAAIPQADEQQRLLANLITDMNLDQLPLPRLWYLPHGERAAVVLTADDHGAGDVTGRFDYLVAASPVGCSVDDWECLRSSGYIYTDSVITDAEAAAYTAEGFEVGLHVNTDCADFTSVSLADDYTSQLANFASTFPSLPPQASERTHCITWSDWATQPLTKVDHGMRLDTNYYYWPGTWVTNRPGMFTGSGFPMRFADLDGSIIDVYQAATQMTDESGQSYPYTIDTLLDGALGPDGYYGVFTANIHTDDGATPIGATSIVGSALSRGVPVVSGRQMADWLDGRNTSSFEDLNWDGTVLSFSVTIGAGANGLQAMVPASSATGAVIDVSLDSAPVPYGRQIIKGVEYATFQAAPGTYTVTYGADTTPPTVVATTPIHGATDIATTTSVTATFNEPVDPATVNTTSFTLTGPGATPIAATVTYDAATDTATLTPDTPLDYSTTHTATIADITDPAGNTMTEAEIWSFATVAAPGCPCTIFDETPGGNAFNDGSGIETGVRFRSSADGFITHIRFYKPYTGGTEFTGTLWTGTGTSLGTGSATLVPGVTGWQQIPLSSPVAITADTTYVASYYSATGDYTATVNGLAAGIDNPPLRALADGEDGPNGVYLIGSGFPTSTSNSNNYWVDVVMDLTDTTPPTVVGRYPELDAIDVDPASSVVVTFSEPVDAATVTSSSLRLRASGSGIDVVASLSVAGAVATLTPTTGLVGGNVYDVAVTGAITDLVGNPLGADDLWSFTTAIANVAPVVSAGSDLVVTLPASALLDGTVTDDGLPLSGSLSSVWTKVSGPGTVTFGDAAAVDTSAGFSTDGVYVLRLTADDGALTASDEVMITVNPIPPSNTAPVVSAGSDLVARLPASALLDGTVTDDGLPLSGSLSSVWTKVSGPGTVTFGDAAAVDTSAGFSTDGVYVLRLTADDGALTASDEVMITVKPKSSPPPPPPPPPLPPPLPPTTVACPELIASAGFGDLGGYSHETVHAIDCLVYYNISTGTTPTTFSPSAPVTRSQMALFLTRQATVHGVVLPAPSDRGFTDIGGLSAATQDAINQLAAMGITLGTTNTTYSPAEHVSRVQMALFLARFCAVVGIDLADPPASAGFEDLGGLSAEAVAAINQLAQIGIAKGKTAMTYDPQGDVLRSQMALFLTRVLEAGEVAAD